MPASEQHKSLVREAYTKAVVSAQPGTYVGADGAALPVANMADDYTHLTGYVAEADLGLGCGLPTEFARIKPGDVVVDLGSGAGIDCFVARAQTGEAGRVIGLDITPAMIDCARQNAEKLGFSNVEFVQADIEAIPLPSGLADVVISNCVVNLVPDKQQAFDEAYRILKMGGYLSLADTVLVGTLPDALRQAARLYAGCVAGAIQEQTYLDLIAMAGFEAIQVQRRQPVHLPDELLRTYLTDDELLAFRETGSGVVSITVYAEKPAGKLVDLSHTDNESQPDGLEPDEDDLGDLKAFDFLGRL